MIWLANQACLELHPWMSRADNPSLPDFLVFDLDPSEGATYEHVCQVAEVLRDILNNLNLNFYLKTSGATGVHVYVPLTRKYNYDQLRDFALKIAEIVVRLIPEHATIIRKVKDRQGKVYVDYLQNIQGKTVCSPYSVRPLPGAPVSCPLNWNELRTALPHDYNIKTVLERVSKLGDLFHPINLGQQNIDDAWKGLNRLFGKINQ